MEQQINETAHLTLSELTVQLEKVKAEKYAVEEQLKVIQKDRIKIQNELHDLEVTKRAKEQVYAELMEYIIDHKMADPS